MMTKQNKKEVGVEVGQAYLGQRRKKNKKGSRNYQV